MIDIQAVARAYAHQHGTAALPIQPYHRIDTDHAARVADEYQNAVHAPTDAAVERSYRLFTQETIEQYDTLIDAGLSVEPCQHEPYADSETMLEDLRAGHLYILAGNADLPDGHPMAAPSGRVASGAELTINDVFRAVHDAFGHGRFGWSFGPRGEDNAYVSHSTMYSVDARMALACETRGQSMWVNYGEHLRREDGTLPGKGDADYVPLSERPYAPQKAAYLPYWVCDVDSSELFSGGSGCEMRDARMSVTASTVTMPAIRVNAPTLTVQERDALTAVKTRVGADVLSAADISRLSFVRWCYQNGRIQS